MRFSPLFPLYCHCTVIKDIRFDVIFVNLAVTMTRCEVRLVTQGSHTTITVSVSLHRSLSRNSMLSNTNNTSECYFRLFADQTHDMATPAQVITPHNYHQCRRMAKFNIQIEQ